MCIVKCTIWPDILLQKHAGDCPNSVLSQGCGKQWDMNTHTLSVCSKRSFPCQFCRMDFSLESMEVRYELLLLRGDLWHGKLIICPLHTSTVYEHRLPWYTVQKHRLQQVFLYKVMFLCTCMQLSLYIPCIVFKRFLQIVHWYRIHYNIIYIVLRVKDSCELCIGAGSCHYLRRTSNWLWLLQERTSQQEKCMFTVPWNSHCMVDNKSIPTPALLAPGGGM